MIGGTVDGQGAAAAERRGGAHRGHVGRRGVPVRAHDRVRQGGRVAAGQDRDAGARARAHQPGDHRPALPPARPAGPAAHGAGLQPVRRSGSGWTRTRRRSSGRTRRWRWWAAARSRSWIRRSSSSRSMARVRKNDPVCLIGLRLHILDHGSTFNLTPGGGGGAGDRAAGVDGVRSLLDRQRS